MSEDLGLARPTAARKPPVGEPVLCAHCGLPALGYPGASVSEPAFCCPACETAYLVIQQAGLGAYYDERTRSEVERTRARASGRSYAEYDEPSFREQYVRVAEGSSTIELYLEGIHCSACVWLVERLPRVVPGVRAASFELGRSALEVRFDSSGARLSDIARALDRLGYAPHASSAARGEADVRRDRSLLTRLGVAGALAGNIMLMALALYSGAASDPTYAELFRWGGLLLAIPAVFYGGGLFLRGGLAALRTRTPHMDLPVSIGILAGFGRSAWNTVLGRGEVYFDSIAVLIFLLLVGRWLQQRHHRGAARTLDLIAALAPATAHVLDGNTTRDVPSRALGKDVVVVVGPEERIPADGIVLEGSSSVDCSWLTGESLPDDVRPGARVYAGTRNLAAELRVRVEVAGTETRLGRLMQSVEQAQAERAPIVRLADRIAARFVLVVLGLAVATFALWSFLDPTRALDHAVALLVVTCPCALAMATPLSVSAALRRAAEAGIFFKGGEFLEALARPGTIAFDKTGTLTEGKLSLVSFTGDETVKALVLAAERSSPHPIGRALVAAFAAERELVADDTDEQAGAGIRARVDGHEVRIGSLAFVVQEGALPNEQLCDDLERQARAGRPAVVVAVDGRLRAVLAFEDPLRADAAASLEALRAYGYEVAVLSGDQPLVVEHATRTLGPLSEARGRMTPQDKLAWVNQARKRGAVVMVGDGVNDAAALVAADVGIAVHGGAESSLVAADAFTTQPGVGKVLEAVVGARRTLAVIHRGMVFSLAYNVIGVGLCMVGWISPLLAALLMPLSSLTVVTTALKARTFDVPRSRGAAS